MSADGGATPPGVLVVASWFPSTDSLTAGRFVADQVSLLAAAGRFAPVVASFDPLSLWGSGALRRREARAVQSIGTAGLVAHPSAVFRLPRAGAPGSTTVAWLPVPGVAGGARPADRTVADRVAALAGAAPAIDAVAGPPVLVHAHIGYPDGAAAAVEAARRGIPLVVTEHASSLAAIVADPRRRARYLEAVEAASRIIVVGHALAAELRGIVPSAAGRIVIIPNVVEVAAFGAVAPGGRRDDELLFVGNRKASKGIGLLLDAFALAHAARPALRLRLVGAAPAALDAGWRRRAADLAIADAVAFEPEMDRGGVAAAMAQAGLFVHPSARETFGVVAAEALAAGLPVVSVDSGGVTEVLGADPDENGAIVPPGDPVRLADAILRTLDRRHEFKPEALRQRAVARFGPAAVLGQLTDLYLEVIAEGPRHGSRTSRRPVADARPSPGPRPGTAPVPASDSIVVVGLDRPRAARILAALELAERGRCRLVTGDGATPAMPDGLGGVRTVAGFAARHAARVAVADAVAGSIRGRSGRRALLGRPGVVLRELWLRIPRKERALLAAATDAIGSIAAPGAALVVLDGFDALAAEPLVGSGRLRPLPGAGRWLAGEPVVTDRAKP